MSKSDPPELAAEFPAGTPPLDQLTDEAAGRLILQELSNVRQKIIAAGLPVERLDFDNPELTDRVAVYSAADPAFAAVVEDIGGQADPDHPWMVAIVRAFSFAARGDLARAGKILKQMYGEGTAHMALARVAGHAIDERQQRQKIAEEAFQEKQDQDAQERERIRPYAERHRETHPLKSNRDLAHDIVNELRREADKRRKEREARRLPPEEPEWIPEPDTVRRWLPKMNLGKRKKLA
jgi:hypothetical protein